MSITLTVYNICLCTLCLVIILTFIVPLHSNWSQSYSHFRLPPQGWPTGLWGYGGRRGGAQSWKIFSRHGGYYELFVLQHELIFQERDNLEGKITLDQLADIYRIYEVGTLIKIVYPCNKKGWAWCQSCQKDCWWKWWNNQGGLF